MLEIKYLRVHPSELHLYHKNPRVGDVEVIASSLRANSQYRPVTVNLGTHTGRPMEVLTGNHTVKAIRTLAERYPDDERWQQVAIGRIDVDEDHATRIVAADNRTADLGGYDDRVLLDLLSDLPDLDGTGYDVEFVDDLRALFEEGGDGNVTDPAPTPRDDGLIDADDLEERGEKYSQGGTRLVVLTMEIAQFVWMQEKFGALRQDKSLGNNTEAVLWLLGEWSGEEPPAKVPVDAEAAEVEVDELSSELDDLETVQ